MPVDKGSQFLKPASGPRIVSVDTANPPDRYTQEEVVKRFNETNENIIRFFKSSHIKSRHLYLPEPVEEGVPDESPRQLIERHLYGAMQLGPEAIEKCLSKMGLAPHDIDYLCCVSSTGFSCPGISARLIKKMGFRENVRRVDILGMGCNAGLNSLQTVASFCKANPGKLGLLVCVEICSAAYVYDDTINTAVVNSLFGDGVAAALIRMDPDDTWKNGPIINDFEPHIVPSAIQAMRFEMEENSKWSFYLERDIPYVLGLECEKPVDRLLGRYSLKRREIDHWIVHSGGKKVIDAIEYNLGISSHDMRHTLNILRNYGNLSSGAFLFSFKELMAENLVKEEDIGVTITMGPGTTIETALLTW
jgi:predicted naringenin-chalcone synthase